MSVAFRREDDDAHREPRFELPIPPGPNLVTAAGLTLLERQVDRLEAGVAALDGDAKTEAERDLRYWRTRLATAELAPAAEAGVAGIGTRIRIRLAGKERTFAVVGHDEADPEAGTIAFTAPLARAVAGLEAGDLAPFNGRDDAIELLAVDASG